MTGGAAPSNRPRSQKASKKKKGSSSIVNGGETGLGIGSTTTWETSSFVKEAIALKKGVSRL